MAEAGISKERQPTKFRELLRMHIDSLLDGEKRSCPTGRMKTETIRKKTTDNTSAYYANFVY
jgi:hypothetical protein